MKCSSAYYCVQFASGKTTDSEDKSNVVSDADDDLDEAVTEDSAGDSKTSIDGEKKTEVQFSVDEKEEDMMSVVSEEQKDPSKDKSSMMSLCALSRQQVVSPPLSYIKKNSYDEAGKHLAPAQVNSWPLHM